VAGDEVIQTEVLEFNTDGYPKRIKNFGFTEEESFTWQNGQLTSRTFKDHTQTFVYNSRRLLEKQIEIDDQEVDYEYDGLLRLDRIIARGGTVTTDNTYNIGNGANYIEQSTTFTDGDDIVQTSYFDGLGRSTQTKVNGVIKSATLYDEFGRVSQQLYMPGYGMMGYIYDNSPLNRAKTEVYPDGNNVSYRYLVDEDGFYEVERTDEKGNITSTSTDVFGRTVRQKDADPDNPGITKYFYTDFDAPIRIEPPAGAWYKYQYDDRRRITSKTIPSGGTTTYDYSDFGNRLRTTNLPNGKSISILYDPYGREVKTLLGNIPDGEFGPEDPDDPGMVLTMTTYGTLGIEKGKVTQTQAAIIKPDGTLGNMVTTDYEIEPGFGRVIGQTEDYTLSNQSFFDTYSFTLDDRDLVQKSDLQHTWGVASAHATFSQEVVYDQFGRPTETTSGLSYFAGGVQGGLLSGSMNILLDYNDADQLTLRRLLSSAQGGYYQERMSYNSRGWLTKINDPRGRSFDAGFCEEPSGDVYAPLISEEDVTLSRFFELLADGNPVVVDDLDCEVDENCTTTVTLIDSKVRVANPEWDEQEDYTWRANIPCPDGSGLCSSAERYSNIDITEVRLVNIYGITPNNEEVRVPLQYSYDLTSVLLDWQSHQNYQSAPELVRLRADILSALQDNNYYIDDVVFNLIPDPTTLNQSGNPTTATTYSLEIDLQNSNFSFIYAYVEYYNTSTLNGVP
ncbi:MAG: hypothetical protein AAFU67_11100, partial [Bacteroidota bacterium]